VTDIESEGIGRVRGFTLRNEDGRTLRFVIEGGTDLSGGGMPADHLREHMTTVTGVAVAFRTEGERRIAIKLTDATDLGQ
jgi:ribosomal protein S6E (S10)